MINQESLLSICNETFFFLLPLTRVGEATQTHSVGQRRERGEGKENTKLSILFCWLVRLVLLRVSELSGGFFAHCHGRRELRKLLIIYLHSTRAQNVLGLSSKLSGGKAILAGLPFVWFVVGRSIASPLRSVVAFFSSFNANKMWKKYTKQKKIFYSHNFHPHTETRFSFSYFSSVFCCQLS